MDTPGSAVYAEPRAESPGRRWLPLALAGGSLLVSVVALPIGLHRVGAARSVADAILLRGDFTDGSGSPLALLSGRLAGFLPIGDLATRVAIGSAFALAIAAAWHARLLGDALLALRPPRHARLLGRDLVHEPIAIAGSVAVILFAPPLMIGYTAGNTPATAITLLMLAIGLGTALRSLRAPANVHDALAFYLVAGLATAVDAIVPALLWPVAAALWLRSLRQGERWPLLAPVVTAMGACVALTAVRFAGHAADPVGQSGGAAVLFDRLTLPGIRVAFAGATTDGAARALLGLTNDIGMVAILLAIVGTVVLGVRAPAVAGLIVFAIWMALLSASDGSLAGPPGASAGGASKLRVEVGRAVLTALTALPIAAGIAYLAGRFGRARAPAAVVLAIIATALPALSGGVARWLPDARLPAALLDRAWQDMPPRVSIDPGGDEMRDLMRYGQALGVRPDLRITTAPTVIRPTPEQETIRIRRPVR